MLIRYPGSKDKHMRFLADKIPARRLCEPFAGTAAVTFALLREGQLASVWINDIDPGIAALWTAVRSAPAQLARKVERYTPSARDFYEFKEHPHAPTAVETAFRKIVLHQISYSGLGLKAGSPIGGRDQRGTYKADCRYNGAKLSAKVRELGKLLASCSDVEVTSLPWDEVLPEATDYFLYLDPPYVVRGKELYAHGELDHGALARALYLRDSWLLSYDDAPEVRDLYEPWARVDTEPVRSHLHHKKISDVVIAPYSLHMPGLFRIHNLQHA